MMGQEEHDTRVKVQDEQAAYNRDIDEIIASVRYEQYLKNLEFYKRLDIPKIQKTLVSEIMFKVWCMRNNYSYKPIADCFHEIHTLRNLADVFTKTPDFLIWPYGSPKGKDGILVECKQVNALDIEIRSDAFKPYSIWDEKMDVKLWLFDTKEQRFSFEPLKKTLKFIENGEYTDGKFKSDGKPFYAFKKSKYKWTKWSE